MSHPAYDDVPDDPQAQVTLNMGTPPPVTDVPLGHEPQQQPQEPPSLEQDFYHRPMQKLNEIGWPLKIHILVALSVSVLCFFIWHFTTPGDPSVSLWWWIFPAFVFGITVSIHHHFAQGKFLEGVITACVIANVMLFFTYKVTATESTFPWWIYPPLITVMVLVPIYYKIKNDPVYSTAFNIIYFEFWLLNLLLFLTWAVLPLHHPWFFYPFIVLGTPLLMYRVRTYYRETRIPVLAGIPIVALNLILFIVWGFSRIGWPWFLIPLAITAGIEVLLIWRFRTHTHQVIIDAPPVYPPSDHTYVTTPDPYNAAPYPHPTYK